MIRRQHRRPLADYFNQFSRLSERKVALRMPGAGAACATGSLGEFSTWADTLLPHKEKAPRGAFKHTHKSLIWSRFVRGMPLSERAPNVE